jgi:hypothetical protein
MLSQDLILSKLSKVLVVYFGSLLQHQFVHCHAAIPSNCVLLLLSLYLLVRGGMREDLLPIFVQCRLEVFVIQSLRLGRSDRLVPFFPRRGRDEGVISQVIQPGDPMEPSKLSSMLAV